MNVVCPVLAKLGKSIISGSSIRKFEFVFLTRYDFRSYSYHLLDAATAQRLTL